MACPAVFVFSLLHTQMDAEVYFFAACDKYLEPNRKGILAKT